MRTDPLLVLAIVSLAGCQSAAPGEDGRDDSFSTVGKADTGGVAEGTPEAKAVLKVANTVSLADLDDPAKVGLAHNAAANIGAVRTGDDGIAGTADDHTFATLAELDAVPFVGPVAFGKLLAYAKSLGLLCTPLAACPASACGAIADGCGGTLSCTCSGPGETCGGGGAANVCGVAVEAWRMGLPSGTINLRYNVPQQCASSQGIPYGNTEEVTITGTNPGPLYATVFSGACSSFSCTVKINSIGGFSSEWTDAYGHGGYVMGQMQGLAMQLDTTNCSGSTTGPSQ
jgi:hypothetical protein